MALGVIVGTFCSFLLGLFNPYLANKAGPDWLWGGGRDDLIRNLYFRPNGTFRRYGRIALLDVGMVGLVTPDLQSRLLQLLLALSDGSVDLGRVPVLGGHQCVA